jgi:hypothetical protein
VGGPRSVLRPDAWALRGGRSPCRAIRVAHPDQEGAIPKLDDSAVRSVAARRMLGMPLFEGDPVLEKPPDTIGHALRGQRAGLEKIAFHAVDLRAGMAQIAVTSLAADAAVDAPVGGGLAT